MALGRFINSSVRNSITLFHLLVEKPKKRIQELIFNTSSVLVLPFHDINLHSYEFETDLSFCPDVYEASLQLRYHLCQWFIPKHALKLDRFCHLIIAKLYQNRELPLDGVAAIVQYLYDTIYDQLHMFDVIGSGFSVDGLLEQVENFVCVSSYELLFCSRPEEEDSELSLQRRIRSLYWVTQGFLETVLKFELEIVEKLLNEAIIGISEINSYKRVSDKMACVSKCSDKISEAIQKSTGFPASADCFIPVLIYVIIRANPTMIQANLWFIRRVSLKSRTMQGESGYQFTNMCSAVQFIQELNAQHLHMSEEMFNAFVSENTPS